MGGGAMRAAAKVAGFTAANGGLSVVMSDQYPVFSAARRAAFSSSKAAVADHVNMVASRTTSGVKTKSSEIEDWVFAGGEEGILSHGDVMHRAVFGGPPTLQEAKDATSELAVALEKVYLSYPDSTGYDGSLVTSETTLVPAVPACALQAFRLLHDSHVVQNVVSSIACDPNVWNAVLHNQELQEFLQSQRACENGYARSNENEPSVDSSDVGSEYSESQRDIGFMDVVERVRFTVVVMMSNLSVYFRNFFGGDEGVDRILAARRQGNSSAEAVMETSFVGLAVMAIMVIIVKRE